MNTNWTIIYFGSLSFLVVGIIVYISLLKENKSKKV